MPKTLAPIRIPFAEDNEVFEVEVPIVWESEHFAVHECVKELTAERKPVFNELPRNRWFRLVHKPSGCAFATARRKKDSIRYGKLAEEVVGNAGCDAPIIREFHTWMKFGDPWDFFNETKPPADLKAAWLAWVAGRAEAASHTVHMK